MSLQDLSRAQKLSLFARLAQYTKTSRLVAQSEDIVELYRQDPLGFITKGLHQCNEESWANWRTILKAAYGKPLNEYELAFFQSVSGGRNPPEQRVKELWLIIGRRGGKDSVASMIATEASCYADEGVALRPGERALVACFATDRDQAGIVHGYIKGYFESVPSLARRVVGALPSSYQGTIALSNRTDIRVVTNNFRAPRGRPIACAIFDEVAFWRSENSAIPDVETYNAVLPGLGTIPNSMLIGISSAYRQSGLLYDRWKDFFGKEDDQILVIQAPTLALHPNYDPSIIQRALDADSEAASAEYLAQWRRDLADYVDRQVVESAVVTGRRLLEPRRGVRYESFCDPSGGSVDSMTLAIAHREGDRGVLDCLLERRAPFQPSTVVEEFAATLRQYFLSTTTGDRYSGQWSVEAFQKHGIVYESSERSKSDIYRDFLPLLNSGRVDLLDIPRMINQLCRLERRTARGGRDSIDHPPNEHDDLANAAAGVLLKVAGELDPVTAMIRMMGH